MHDPLPHRASHRRPHGRTRHRTGAALLRCAVLSVLVPPAAATTATAAAAATAAELARAQEIVMGQCFICHGAEGESSSPLFPRLAGQHAQYTARQLADYQSGRRRSTTMQPMVQALQPGDFLALGRFFEQQPVRAHAVEDPQLARMGQGLFERGKPDAGVPACTACHGAQGAGTETLPRLAGQHAQYTLNQLRQFDRRERTNDNAVMHTIAARLSEMEMKALAQYISGLK